MLVQIHPEIFVDSSGYEDAIQEADRIEKLKRSQSMVESCLILMDVFVDQAIRIPFRKSSAEQKIQDGFDSNTTTIFREKW